MTLDVLVIGTGIVGSACAEQLSRAGLKVCLVDAATEIASAATAAGMGHIVTMDDSAAQFALTRYSQELWEDLYPDLPDACEVTRPGTLWVACDDEEFSVVQTKAEFYLDHGVTCEILTAAELSCAEPQLRTGFSGALLVPGDRVVYPPVVARVLLDRAREAGAQLRMGEAVVEVRSSAVTLASGATLEAREIVVAAGCASLNLLAPALRSRCALSLLPRKGHLCITERRPGFLRHQIVELGYLKSAHSEAADSVAFNVQPRATGQVLLGSSRQFGVTTADVDAALVARMIRRALEFMPGLAQLQVIRTWCGFRAATKDHLPLIGRLSAGVCLATGHEGLGITTSLGTAALITDLLLDRESAIDPRPYRADREVASV